MNQKTCKRLRKSLRAVGCPTASLVMRYTKTIHNSLGGDAIEYPLPLTFKYKVGSFQRSYRDAKSGKYKTFKIRS